MEQKDITYEKLYDLYVNQGLSDNQIADMFNVSPSAISYKRKKWEINLKEKFIKELESPDSEVFKKLNYEAKNRLLKSENINSISKALTHYIFRNGPIEDMHANGQLSQDDMKVLNKYMVNRIAGILIKISENKWFQLELLYSFLKLYGSGWDTPKPDTTEIDFIWEKTKNEIPRNLKNE